MGLTMNLGRRASPVMSMILLTSAALLGGCGATQTGGRLGSSTSASSTTSNCEQPVRLQGIDPSFAASAWNLVLTVCNSDQAAVTEQAAETTALASYPLSTTESPPHVKEIVLARARGRNGLPSNGHLVWVLDLSPAAPFHGPGSEGEPNVTPTGGQSSPGSAASTRPTTSTSRYLIALVDAQNGMLDGYYTG